ncbi:HNH endonuclease [Luteimicrobium subarcticum]|uniref:Putative restriction endonuclease n=1 Tax=Luteimicrobium subarcticum TaxID=620910 RepID=A0A2M8WW34_9MICO|nr:HNH endonuclease [Luteimicrobium subarcticum]PJI95132.1 putative restriction endonuclease [Luteimicrobium subarcticum]
MDSALEAALRRRIIDWVMDRADANGGFLRREELLSFRIDGEKLPIIDYSRGIRNPASFGSTLSIVSTPHGPYDDAESEDGLLHYSYRDGDPWSGDNRKLRNALTTRMPLILFRKEVANIYTPVAPVYVVDDYPEVRQFVIALDESFTFIPEPGHLTVPQKEYALRLSKQRLHQPIFRTRVLRAYAIQCAVCQLKHGSLLDAAHILPDSDERGIPAVTNGLALCKIHHAAYDQNMMGITPDHRVEIALDLLAEIDGPMLKHGLQEMHGRTINVPRRRDDQPSADHLAERYAQFAAARG